MGENMKRTNHISKAVASLLMAIITVFVYMPLTSLAINENFDNPDDDLISQNEQLTDLLSENPEDAPSVSADAYILYDANSGTILRGSNYDVQKEPASMTKVMTILLALEKLEMTDIVTITPEMAAAMAEIPGDYVRFGLQEGEEITVKDLVYAAELISANDCCLALGMYMGGTEAEFCAMMNEKAAELGCKNTNFTSAFGYADPENLTTAYDLSLILYEAVSNTEFTEISKTYSYTVNATNKYSDTRELTNANRFIKDSDFAYDYYVGGKTGFTDTAGFTLCAAACKDGRTLVGVVFNAEDSEVRYRDLVSLFEYGFSHYTTVPVSEEEFSSLIDEARLQLDDLLADTNLYVESQTCAMSSYVTTTTERAQLGSSDKVDLSQVLVDSSASEQTINIPLCKCYSDKTYIVGSLNIEITQNGSVVEITPEKKTGLKTFRNILITFAAASGLILVLIIALLIFRRKIIQRRREQSGQRSKML